MILLSVFSAISLAANAIALASNQGTSNHVTRDANKDAVKQCMEQIDRDAITRWGSATSPTNDQGPHEAKCPGITFSDPNGAERRSLQDKARRAFDTAAPNPYSCLPLVSKHMSANPYHDLLTGLPAGSILVRSGQGNGFNIASSTGVSCPNTDKPCAITITSSTTTTSSWMMSVSDAISTSYTSSNSTSWGSSASLTHSDQISRNLELSMQHTNTSDLSGSKTTEIQNILQKTHENATDHAHTNGRDNQKTDTTTWDVQDYHLLSHESGSDTTTESGHDTTQIFDNTNEAGESNQNMAQLTITCDVVTESKDSNYIAGSVEADPFWGIAHVSLSVGRDRIRTTANGFHFTFTVSRTNTKDRRSTSHCGQQQTSYSRVATVQKDSQNAQTGYIENKGGSTAMMEGHSHSDTATTRNADTISQSLLTGSTNSSGWSNSKQDMRGVTVGFTVGNNIERSAVDNRNNDLTSSVGSSKTNTVAHQFTKSISITTGVDQTLNVPVNSCRWVVCRTPVKSLLVPHACTTSNGGINFYTAEMQKVSTSGVNCELELVPCGSKLPGFTPNPVRVYSALNTLPYGVSIPFNSNPKLAYGSGCNRQKPNTINIICDSSSGVDYTLAFLTSTKQIGVFLGNNDAPLWRSGDYALSGSMLNITSKGHLVLWGQGVFSNDTSYWAPVWSTQPYHLQQYSVGMNGASFKYRLHIGADRDGELSLIDGYEVQIWSSLKSTNKLGYKFPFSSLYPSVNPTDGNAPGQVDPHNSLPSDMTVIGDTLFNTGCKSVLKQSQALQSIGEDENGNKRTYSLYLAPTGNLVFYDGSRIMWESRTADLRYGQAPYRGMFLADGSFAVKDSRNTLIWGTQIKQLTRVYLSIYGEFLAEDAKSEEAIANGDESTHAWGLTYEYNGWVLYDRAVTQCDDCSACQLANLVQAPMKHLLTGAVLPGNWTYNYVTQYYRDMSQSTTPSLGGDIQWRHYGDGLLSSINSQDTCLGLNGKTIRCTEGNTVLDKLWSHGPFIMTQLNQTNPFLLYGHTMQNAVMYPNGTLQVGDRVVYAPKTPL
ncbi:hypothetical protein HDU77_000922, partial [Chytriomyces hyalinus]